MNVQTWLDGYLEIRSRAFEARGAIELSSGQRWPRTTGTDVLAIAGAFDRVLRTQASADLIRRWRAVIADIELDARAWPRRTYVGNRSFWAILEVAALWLDDLSIRPPGSHAWNAIVQAIGTEPRNAGLGGDGPFKVFDGVKTFDELYVAQLRYLSEMRGFDQMKPDAGALGAIRPIPRSTNGDVIALADFWGKQLADVKSVMGTAGVTSRWRAAVADVDTIARSGNATAVYAKNNAFWRVLQQTAIHVAVADEAPSKWDLIRDSVTESVKHLPQTLGHAASQTVGALADTAQAAGTIVGAAGKGVFSGIAVPLLVGGGLLGAFLLVRGARGGEETSRE